MKLSEILEPIRNEIENDDKVRETILQLSREATRRCSQAIKETHRGDFDAAEELISLAAEIIKRGIQESEKSGFISETKYLDVPYQEITEASCLLAIIRNGTYISPEKLQIPSRPFLTGLADTVGELRRSTLDALRDDRMEDAKKYLKLMEDIHEELVSFDYPNALIPGLRKKTDISRRIVEQTRGDITTAVRQNKMIHELRQFEEKLD